MLGPSTSQSAGTTATFELTDAQSRLRDKAASSATHILGVGGSRSGKTFGFCYCVATRALMAPASRHLICRLQNIDVRQSVMMDTWPNMMRKAYPGVPMRWNRSDQYCILPDDSEVWFLGLDDKERVEKILGKEYATIYPNEVSQIAYETILTLRTRLAQKAFKRDGRSLDLKMYYDLNPTGRGHWTHSEFIEGKSPVDHMPLDITRRAHEFLNPGDNPHLPQAYLDELDALPERQRQRFRDGKYLSEVPGTLWPLSRIEALRRPAHPPLKRVVIGVDPSGSDGVGGDSQGIVVVGLGVDDEAYVLADLSCRLSPEGWARVVARAALLFGADRIVAERNYGGAMVEAVLRAAETSLPVTLVTASRGKHLRAEPVAAIYEQKRAHHVGNFTELEEQMGMMTTAGYQGGASPDRLDALVWALTELMLPADTSHTFAFG
ncbi:MAG TPA: phage terminase large subunit [Sphingobium sp.]|uniref:phage terminase large subunit n=1 Tax=Sphingobium sp. TaxID=1912891 RepID=UPI002ED5CC8A